MAVGDTLMVGSELIQGSAMPRGPDDDIRFESFEGAAPGPARYDARSARHRYAGL